MKKTISLFLILGLFIFSSNVAVAQYENTSGQKQEGKVNQRKKPPKVKRWFAGGMLGAGFSSYSSYVEIAPIIGYKVTPAFHIASRVSYIYNERLVFSDNRPSWYWEDEAYLNHYGISLFARYIIFKGLFAQVEYEILSLNTVWYNVNQQSPSFSDLIYGRSLISSLFLGGGYLQNIGGTGFMSIAILFNVLDNENSPYINPIIRIGFGAGF